MTLKEKLKSLKLRSTSIETLILYRQTGGSDKMMGDALGIHARTCKQRMYTTMKRLGFKNRLQMLRWLCQYPIEEKKKPQGLPRGLRSEWDNETD